MTPEVQTQLVFNGGKVTTVQGLITDMHEVSHVIRKHFTITI